MTGLRAQRTKGTKMKHKSVIVVQKAGQVINPAYLGRVFKEYNTYVGVATVNDGKLAVERVKAKPSLELVTQITEAFGKNTIVFSFGNADASILEEDLQPFTVLHDADKNPIMAAFLDGGFEGYSVPKSTHTDEFHCITDFIEPKMKKIYKFANSGIAGVIAELGDPVTQKDFSNAWTNRGNILLLPVEGDPVTYSSQNMHAGTYNWGWVSHSLGYVEQTVAKVEPKKEEAAKPMTLAEKLKAKIAGKPVADAPVKTPDAKVTAPPKTETVIHKQEISEDLEWVGPAPSSLNNGQKKTWWMDEVGYVPDAYKKSIKVQRKKGTKVGVLAGLKGVKDAATPISNDQIKAEAKVKMAAEQPQQVEVPITDKPITLPKEEKTFVKDTSVHNPAMTMDVMPILSPKQKLKTVTEWQKNAEVLKILGDDMKQTFDPKMLKSFEEEYPLITDALNISSFDNLMGLSFKQIFDLGTVELKALAILAFNVRNEWYKTKLQLDEVLTNPNNKIQSAPQRIAM